MFWLDRLLQAIHPELWKIATPLTSLLKKSDSKGWKWPPEAATAFTNLKNALMSAPLLAMSDFDKPFTIDCDASGMGLGAILIQQGQLVAYFSMALSERTLAKFAYEKELMALILAIEHW